MRDMKKAERHAQIRRRAIELAQTGHFGGWLQIEQELAWVEGFTEARDCLDEPGIRLSLDNLCKRSPQVRPDA